MNLFYRNPAQRPCAGLFDHHPDDFSGRAGAIGMKSRSIIHIAFNAKIHDLAARRPACVALVVCFAHPFAQNFEDGADMRQIFF
jgi:hypothetical protein